MRTLRSTPASKERSPGDPDLHPNEQRTLAGDPGLPRGETARTEQLNPEQFWRVHRSFVVNIQHIREVVPWFKSSYQLRMDDRKQTEIPVSRSQTKRLRELFNL